jgi:hypothetical protein
MPSAIVRRAFVVLTIVSALTAQVVLIGRQHVICCDREGAQEECADLLGRCHCHVHERNGHPQRPVGEKPGLSGDRAHLPCDDISVGQDWRGSQPFQFSAGAADVLAGLTAMRFERQDRIVPASASGLSPPPGGSSRCSLLSSRRC